MKIFLNRLLGPKISYLPSYSPSCFIKYRPLPTFSNPLSLFGPGCNPLPSVSIRHTPLPFLIYNPIAVSFYTPVLASPDKATTPNEGETVPVMNGINPANTGKSPPSIFMFEANCVFFIIMPLFASYAFINLSSCDFVMTIMSHRADL